MTYEYNSILKPYIADFLVQRKLVVSKFHYDHNGGILKHFDQFVLEHGYDNINFTEEQILHWISTLEVKQNTLNYYVGTLRAFFKFLWGYGFHPFMPPYSKEDKEYMAYEFSDEELNVIFSFADNYVLKQNSKAPNQPHPCRKYRYAQYELPMILRIFLGCGLRLEEASTLQMKDIDFNNDTLTIRKTKSKEYRLVPMDPSLADILAKYCKAFGLGADPEAYIFPGTDFSKPIPSYCFRNYFNRLLKETEIALHGRKKHERGPCLHCFRHAFAHRSFKKGMSEGWAVNDQIPWLSVYLGHKNLQETERYLKFNSEMFADEIAPFESYSMDLYPEVNFDD